MAFRSSTAPNSTAAATSRTWNKPAGLAVGDILVLVACNNGSDNPSAWTKPTGFIDIAITQQTNPKFGAQYKVAVQADVDATDFTWSWGSSVAGAGALGCWSGRHATPLDITPTEQTATTGTTLVLPDMTPTVTGCDEIVGIGANSGSATFTVPGADGWTEDYDAGAGKASTMAHKDNVGAGATGTKTFTQSNSSQPRIGVHILLRPAAAGGSAVPVMQQHYRQMRAA